MPKRPSILRKTADSIPHSEDASSNFVRNRLRYVKIPKQTLRSYFKSDYPRILPIGEEKYAQVEKDGDIGDVFGDGRYILEGKLMDVESPNQVSICLYTDERNLIMGAWAALHRKEAPMKAHIREYTIPSPEL